MKRAFINLGLSTMLAIGGTHATAQTVPSRGQQQNFELTATPAGLPTPALKYRLLPPQYALTPGNAAPIYYNAALLVPKQSDAERDQQINWASLSIDQLPREKAKLLLEGYSAAFAQLDTAARRDRCDWDPAFREQQFFALLPQLGPLRDAARALALKARLQIAEGKFDEAIHDLQTGYALAVHVQTDGALIQVLVGAAIARLFDGVVRDWQAAPGSPNLYWALAELPRPFATIAKSVQREQTLLIQMFPLLKDPDHATPEQWQAMVSRWNEIAPQLGDKDAGETAMRQIELVALTARLLPAARAELVASGWDKGKVDSLPPQQCVAMYCSREFRRVSDDMIKWMSLPYPAAHAGLVQAERALDDASKRADNPLFSFIPAFSRAATNGATVDRELAMLQTIEAIRAYAATNAGKLPGQLDELASTPAPINPMTGQPFDYRVDGDTAVLSDSTTAGSPAEYSLKIKL